MSTEVADFARLSKKIADQERKLRRRSFALYAIPVFAAILLIYSSTIQRLYFSYRYDVPFSQVDLAKQQNALWRKNIACVGNMVPQGEVTLKDGTEIDILVCASGDILMRVTKKNGASYYRWIANEGLLENEPLLR